LPPRGKKKKIRQQRVERAVGKKCRKKGSVNGKGKEISVERRKKSQCGGVMHVQAQKKARGVI